MSIKMEVWGDYACFTRPEMKVERVSYDVPTPSAARGMVESVYFHNGLRWIIDRIYVCNPIRFINIRRNEVPFKVSRDKILREANGRARSYINRKEKNTAARHHDAPRRTLRHRSAFRNDRPSQSFGQSRQISGHREAASAQRSGVHAAVSWVSGMHGAFPALGWRRNPRHRRNEGFGLYAF